MLRQYVALELEKKYAFFWILLSEALDIKFFLLLSHKYQQTLVQKYYQFFLYRMVIIFLHFLCVGGKKRDLEVIDKVKLASRNKDII